MKTTKPIETTLKNIQNSLAFIGDLNRLEAHEEITHEENKTLNRRMLPPYSGAKPGGPINHKLYHELLCKTLIFSAQYDLPVLCYKTLELIKKELIENEKIHINKYFMTTLMALAIAQDPQELPYIETITHNIISPEICTTHLISDQLLQVYLNDDKDLNNLEYIVKHALAHKDESEENLQIFHAIFLALNLTQNRVEELDEKDNTTHIKEEISTLIETMSQATLLLTGDSTKISLFTNSNTSNSQSDTASVISNLTTSDLTTIDLTTEDEEDDEKDPLHP